MNLLCDSARVTAQLMALRLEHRELDAAIERMAGDATTDELTVKRLKKRKLRIKDMVSYLENQLIPDLDA